MSQSQTQYTINDNLTITSQKDNHRDLYDHVCNEHDVSQFQALATGVASIFEKDVHQNCWATNLDLQMMNEVLSHITNNKYRIVPINENPTIELLSVNLQQETTHDVERILLIRKNDTNTHFQWCSATINGKPQVGPRLIDFQNALVNTSYMCEQGTENIARSIAQVDNEDDIMTTVASLLGPKVSVVGDEVLYQTARGMKQLFRRNR